MQTNFQLMIHHNYSLADLDGMIPWEREVYVSMLLDWLKEERQRVESQRNRK
jgi:hypothetical protein